METLNSTQLIASIIGTAIVTFLAGRAYQAAKSKWTTWRTTSRSVPGLRRGAFAAIGSTIRMIGIAILVVGALAAAAYARGES